MKRCLPVVDPTERQNEKRAKILWPRKLYRWLTRTPRLSSPWDVAAQCTGREGRRSGGHGVNGGERRSIEKKKEGRGYLGFPPTEFRKYYTIAHFRYKVVEDGAISFSFRNIFF